MSTADWIAAGIFAVLLIVAWVAYVIENGAMP